MIHELRSAVSTNSSQFFAIVVKKMKILLGQAPASASVFCCEEVVAAFRS